MWHRHTHTHIDMYRHPLHNANKSSLQAPDKTLKSVPTECAGPLLWPAPVPYCSTHCTVPAVKRVEYRVQRLYSIAYTSVSLSRLVSCRRFMVNAPHALVIWSCVRHMAPDMPHPWSQLSPHRACKASQ